MLTAIGLLVVSAGLCVPFVGSFLNLSKKANDCVNAVFVFLVLSAAALFLANAIIPEN